MLIGGATIVVVSKLRVKATETHSEYVILMAFPLQHWLHERASLLRYMYIAYLVIILVRDKVVNPVIFLLL